MNVNIIQHPNGLPKTIAIRNNLLTARSDTRLLYETDTDFGSSGAPVFNDQWDVVALHHYGAPSAPPQSAGGQPPPSSVNEGIRISVIFNDLKDRAAKLDPVAQEMVTRALSLMDYFRTCHEAARTSPGGATARARRGDQNAWPCQCHGGSHEWPCVNCAIGGNPD